MAWHRSRLGGGILLMCVVSCCCAGQTNVHLSPSTNMTLDAERFSFKIDIMGTGNPAIIDSFPSKDPVLALVTVDAKQPKQFIVGPEVSKEIEEPKPLVPCADTTAKVVFYFRLDENKTQTLFVNILPGDVVLLECEISGQVEAIRLP